MNFMFVWGAFFSNHVLSVPAIWGMIMNYTGNDLTYATVKIHALPRIQVAILKLLLSFCDKPEPK